MLRSSIDIFQMFSCDCKSFLDLVQKVKFCSNPWLWFKMFKLKDPAVCVIYVRTSNLEVKYGKNSLCVVMVKQYSELAFIDY